MKTLWKIPWIHFWDFCWGWYLIYFSYGYVLAVNTSEDGFTKSYWETHSLHFTRIKMEVSQICRHGTIHTAVHDHCHNHPKHSQRHLGSAEALSPSPQHTMETLLFSCIVVGCTHCNRPHVLGKRWKVLGLWERKGMWFCLSNISWPHHFPKNDLHNKKRPHIHKSMNPWAWAPPNFQELYMFDWESPTLPKWNWPPQSHFGNRDQSGWYGVSASLSNSTFCWAFWASPPNSQKKQMTVKNQVSGVDILCHYVYHIDIIYYKNLWMMWN